MSLLEIESIPPRVERAPIPMSDVDLAVTAQIVVAWAGETGEDKRLGWWRSDLVSEFGGEDLFRRLLPSTWPWAVLQGAREAARRKDAELRRADHDPDRIVSLFSLGFELDERLDERFQDLKRSGALPHEALSGIAIIGKGWDTKRFQDWIDDHGTADTTTTPLGRHLKGAPPAALDRLISKLVAALSPTAKDYPLPHFRRTL